MKTHSILPSTLSTFQVFRSSRRSGPTQIQEPQSFDQVILGSSKLENGGSPRAGLSQLAGNAAAATAASLTPGALGSALVKELRHQSPPSMYDKTTVKRALTEGEQLLYGAELSSANTATAETMAQGGAISLVFIDDDSARPMDIVNLNNALQSSPALPIVSFDRADDHDIKQKLDSGAMGAMLSGAETQEEVREFLDRLYFSPLGNRPGGPAKASQYLAPGRFIEMVERSNEVMVGAISIDSETGAKNAASLFTVPNLDLVMVQRQNLSPQSVTQVESSALEAGVTLGTWASTREEALELHGKGYRAVTIGSDLSATDRALDAYSDIARQAALEPAPLNEQTVAEKTQSMKNWLEEGKMVGVSFLMTPDKNLARRLAERSNALWIDAEHGPFDPQSVAELLPELPEGTRTVVRVGSWDHPHIEDYLKMGVQGVVAPSVETPEQASAFVQKVKSHKPEALAVVMIETVKGVENAESIARTEGIDVLHMGPFDLSLSLRQPIGSEAHRQAIERVEKAAREAGVPLGGVPGTPQGPRRSRAYEMHDRGYQFLTTVSDQEANSALFSSLIPALSPAQQALRQGALFHSEQAFEVMDKMIEGKDPVTGLLPLHFETQDGRVTPTSHTASGLDMGRQTAGLVMAAEVAQALGQAERAERYLSEAKSNYAKGVELLAQGDRFVQRRDFNNDGSVKSTEVGEPGKSAPGQDNATRVNPRGYSFRGAAELYRVTGEEKYKKDFDRFFQTWVQDFHDPVDGGFFIHSNIEQAGDHHERGNFMAPGGVASTYDGSRGVKGNDGSVYAMSAVLLTANEVLGTEQTQGLVKEQMDLILDKFHRVDGMLWENYTADFQPISQDWQNQPRENGLSSHVAIGGHTAMAPQQIIEGARQLKAQGAIDQDQYDGYIQKTVVLFQDFASHSGAVDWESGAVHNAIRVEEPDKEKRWLENWGDAAWQQAELLQTLVRFQEEGRLDEIKGPDQKTGTDLLVAAQNHYQQAYGQVSEQFGDYFGNPDVYHRPQVAQYFAQALAKKG